jgi:ABC-type nitrate/sulfonate/bicarbonate transport system substrate-binding protein
MSPRSEAAQIAAPKPSSLPPEGLGVVPVQVDGRARLAQLGVALIAGEYDITDGNYTSAVLAAQKGLPILVIAGNDVGADDHAIMVAEDSRFQGPPTSRAPGSR